MQTAAHIYSYTDNNRCCTPQTWSHKLFEGVDISMINHAISHHFPDCIWNVVTVEDNSWYLMNDIPWIKKWFKCLIMFLKLTHQFTNIIKSCSIS